MAFIFFVCALPWRSFFSLFFRFSFYGFSPSCSCSFIFCACAMCFTGLGRSSMAFVLFVFHPCSLRFLAFPLSCLLLHGCPTCLGGSSMAFVFFVFFLSPLVLFLAFALSCSFVAVLSEPFLRLPRSAIPSGLTTLGFCLGWDGWVHTGGLGHRRCPLWQTWLLGPGTRGVLGGAPSTGGMPGGLLPRGPTGEA